MLDLGATQRACCSDKIIARAIVELMRQAGIACDEYAQRNETIEMPPAGGPQSGFSLKTRTRATCRDQACRQGIVFTIFSKAHEKLVSAMPLEKNLNTRRRVKRPANRIEVALRLEYPGSLDEKKKRFAT